MLQTLNAVGQLYVGAFAVSGLICVVAIRRALQVEEPDVRRGLVWLLATAGGWALFKAAFFVLPAPFRKPTYIAGLAVGFGTVWAWLYFASAYTGRSYHRNTTLRRVSGAVLLTVISLKLTNPIHGAYFTATSVTTPFAHLAIEHNVLHWTATGLAYVLAAVGLFLIFQRFTESGYDTRPLSGLVVLIALPVVLDITAQFTPLLLNVIYAPIGVAAFTVGVLFVFERRFLAVQGTTTSGGRSIHLDERGRIRDYTASSAELLPELDGAIGDRFSETLPSVAALLDSEDPILEREQSGELRYYYVSSTTVTLGEAQARLIQLSDVTSIERQRNELAEREQELDERNELYRAVIGASFAFVFRIDRNGRFTFVSPSVEEFLGYTADELDGESVAAVIPDTEAIDRAWGEIGTILEGESTVVRDFPLETKAGSNVYTDIRGVPIYQADLPADERTPADIVGIQLMVRDTTERRQREGIISVINRVLRHNVRNKMTVITGYAEMLETSLDGDDAAKATQIRDTADRLIDLTESAQKIEANRDVSPELSETDIVPLLDRTVSKLRMQYPAVSVTVDAPDAAVAMTHERLETALWEIVENAAKHGGDPPVVDIAVRTTDRRVTIAVGDDGPGLSEMEREVLESDTETPLVHGDGLGLWLAYWIITSVDGDIEATASPTGTTVTVHLPKPG